MYHELDHYLDSTYKWIDKVGLGYIAEIIMDDAETSKAYYERLVFSQKFYQVNSLTERVAGKEVHGAIALRWHA